MKTFLAALAAFLIQSLGHAQPLRAVPSTAIAAPSKPTGPDPSRWAVHRQGVQGKVFRAKGEAIVWRKSSSPAGLTGIAGVKKGRRLAVSAELVSFDEGSVDFESMRKRLAGSGEAVRVEPNIRVSKQAPSPEQERFVRSLNYRSIQGKRFDPGRRKGKKVRQIRVGIMDTGLDFLHPDLAGKTGKGVNLIYDRPALSVPGEEDSDSTEMDYNGHGTMVAGIIGAGHNGFGVDGLNEDARMFGIKVIGRDGSGALSDVIAGIQWAMDNKMDIVNMSFGSYEHSAILEEFVSAAYAQGILLVASAGNDYSDQTMYPAKYADVIGAGSLNAEGIVSDFSNWGSDIAIFAPGEDLMSTFPVASNNPYEKFSGTSAAAAFVSGALSQAMEEGLNNKEAKAILLKTALRSHDLFNPMERSILSIDEENMLASLRKEKVSQLTLTALTAKRMVWKHDEDVKVEFRYQNSGTVPQKAGRYSLLLQGPSAGSTIAGGSLPALLPGQEYSGTLTLGRSQLVSTGSWTLRLVHESDQHPQVFGSERIFGFLVEDRATPRSTLLGMWVDDLGAGKKADRKLHLNLANLGNAPLESFQVSPEVQLAGHCGLDEEASKAIGSTLPMNPLAPGERRLITLAVPDLDIPTDRDFTVLARLHAGEKPLGRFHKQMAWKEDGEVTLQYAQVVHRWIVTEAVKLLEKQGIYIPDLMEVSRGYLNKGPTPYMNLGAGDPTGLTNVINTINFSTSGFWSDGVASNFPTDFTAVNGAHDCDETDIAFHYSSGDKWNSHFWLVNSHDDDGRSSGHSALTKIRALMFGKSVVSDTKLQYGAIDHYKNGYKKAAWWFMGHVLHLIGDLSVPTHIDDDSHGLYGDAYHNWMDHGHYNEYGNADVALADGGFIDPYQSHAGADPVRFLSYTTAQVGKAWPWVSTWVGPEWGQMGTRTPRGSGATYSSYMNGIYAKMIEKNRTIPNMPDIHPVYTHHLDREEIKDFCAPTSLTCLCCTECQMVETRNPVSEEYRDCWDGGDGHIDKDNTDDDGGKGYGVNTSDNDLRAIAQVNINYAIRAAAGMLVYFANETNIFSGYRTVPAVNHVLLF